MNIKQARIWGRRVPQRLHIANDHEVAFEDGYGFTIRGARIRLYTRDAYDLYEERFYDYPDGTFNPWDY